MTHRQRIGSKIQELRVQRGLSVRQLADMSGVIYSNLSKIENGRYNVSVDILGKIADALGVELTFTEKNMDRITLYDLRDYINNNEDWDLAINDIIERNGWHDDTGEEYGICSTDSHRLRFNDNMIAEVIEKGE